MRYAFAAGKCITTFLRRLFSCAGSWSRPSPMGYRLATLRSTIPLLRLSPSLSSKLPVEDSAGPTPQWHENLKEVCRSADLPTGQRHVGGMESQRFHRSRIDRRSSRVKMAFNTFNWIVERSVNNFIQQDGSRKGQVQRSSHARRTPVAPLPYRTRQETIPSPRGNYSRGTA